MRCEHCVCHVRVRVFSLEPCFKLGSFDPSAPALAAMRASADLQPKRGDRILIYRKGIIETILAGKKTLEIRSRNFKAGRYFLGCHGCIHAVAQLGPATRIDTLGDFERLRPSHLMIQDALPYDPTWALPIESVEQMRCPYRHPKGAITIVKYRPPA